MNPRKLYDSFVAALYTILRHLKLSITSIDFYSDVYRYYSGYGVKYLFTISCFSSLVYCAVILNYIVDLKEYFVHDKVSSNTALVDYVFKQIPDISYDGKFISPIDGQDQVFLYGVNKAKLVAIDPKNQLSFVERKVIPLIFTSDRLILSFMDAPDPNNSRILMDYPKIFGSEKRILTAQEIKNQFGEMISYVPNIFIYLISPLFILLRFVVLIFEQSFIVILLYFISNFFVAKTPIKTCIRLTMFSSGVSTLLQSLIILSIPVLSWMIWAIQMACNVLMFAGVVNIRKKQ